MVKNLPAVQETWVRSQVGKMPWRGAWQLTSVFLPGESHGQRSLVGYSPQGCRMSDRTEANLAGSYALTSVSAYIKCFMNVC